MHLDQGWNLTSLPFTDSANLMDESGLSDCYIFRLENGSYIGGDTFPEIKPGYGYWIYCPTSRDVTLDVSLTQETNNYSVNIYPGWNLIGPAFDEDMDWTGGRIEWDGAAFSGDPEDFTPCVYDGEDYATASASETLVAGQGVWIFTSQETTLTFMGANPLEEVEWAVLVYMAADNNLTEAALLDLAEIKYDYPNVTYLAQVEFSPLEENGGDKVPSEYVGQTMRFRTGWSSPQTLGNLNMADPQTLTDFIEWAASDVNAEHLLLVLWDHGDGWQFADADNPAKSAGRAAGKLLSDDTAEDVMSTTQAAQAVADAYPDIDVLLFDACLMGMYEVAYEFKDTADYLVFSEHSIPEKGAPYDTIIEYLNDNPLTTPRDAASMIVDKYYASYNSPNMESATLSAVDTTRIDALQGKVLSLAAAMKTLVESGYNEDIKSTFYTTQFYDNVTSFDLYSFAEQIVANETFDDLYAETVAEDFTTWFDASGLIVNNKVVSGYSDGEVDVSNSHGLTIYFPLEVAFIYEVVDKDELLSYDYIACNKDVDTSWADFIYRYHTDTGFYP